MAGKKHFKVHFTLGYGWDKEILAKDPNEAKAIAEKERNRVMRSAGDVEFFQASVDFVENYERKVGKVAELARNIQKEQGNIQIKRLVELATSKGGADEFEVRLAIDKLIQMELLMRVRPGVVRWMAES